MVWQLQLRGARCHSLGFTTLAWARGRIAPYALSMIKPPAHPNTETYNLSGLGSRLCTDARNGHAKRTAASASSANGLLGASPVRPTAAAFACHVPFGSASAPFSGISSAPLGGSSLAAVFEACGGPRTQQQERLLALESQLARGVLRRMHSTDRTAYVAASFSLLDQASTVWSFLRCLCPRGRRCCVLLEGSGPAHQRYLLIHAKCFALT